MVDVSRETYERNGVETIVDSNGILWLNQKHNERLDHKNVRVTTEKYFSDHRKHRCELVEESKNPKEFLYKKN